MLDVDRFKSDQRHLRPRRRRRGAARAGAALRVARRGRRDERRAPDLVARWGGEEFCALIAGVDDPVVARAAGERIREAIVAAPFRLASGTEIAVTISAGVTVGTGSIEHLVDEADRALYTAKRRGRDQVRLFTDLGPADLVPGDSDAVRLAQALAFAVETREGAQDLHSRHVSDLSGAVAAHLGLPDAMVERCRLAGWLHDVGKLTIPDAVVAADGGLSAPTEQEIMKAHATIGDQLVSTMPGLAEAHLGVRHHHERFDGTGYPDGLAGVDDPARGAHRGRRRPVLDADGPRRPRPRVGHRRRAARRRHAARPPGRGRAGGRAAWTRRGPSPPASAPPPERPPPGI